MKAVYIFSSGVPPQQADLCLVVCTKHTPHFSSSLEHLPTFKISVPTAVSFHCRRCRLQVVVTSLLQHSPRCLIDNIHRRQHEPPLQLTAAFRMTTKTNDVTVMTGHINLQIKSRAAEPSQISELATHSRSKSRPQSMEARS